MFVVDTNILAYAADVDAPQHARCQRLLAQWREQPSPWFLTWSIVYEFLRLSTHRNIFRQPWSVGQSWSFLASLWASPGLRMLTETERHASVAEEVFREIPEVSGNLLHDVHIAVLMRENGVRRIYTRDADFLRFPFLEVVDPLSPLPGVRERRGAYRARRKAPKPVAT